MITEKITTEFAQRLETADLNAWVNMFENAPADYAENFGLEIEQVDDVIVFLCRKIPFPHFNAVINLGLKEPVTEEKLDKILAVYHEANSSKIYIHYNPFLQPENLPEMLSAKGLQIRSGWERIYRDDSPLEVSANRENIQKVTVENRLDWANFVSNVYGLPTAPWLANLTENQGWHHYIEKIDGKITAARTMFLGKDNLAWFGIDAPVPGLMIPSYDADFRLCRAMVEDALKLGAKLIVMDIEKPAPEMNTEPYRNFASIGFKHAYLRQNYMF
jgi:hypothetical protein